MTNQKLFDWTKNQKKMKNQQWLVIKSIFIRHHSCQNRNNGEVHLHKSALGANQNDLMGKLLSKTVFGRQLGQRERRKVVRGQGRCKLNLPVEVSLCVWAGGGGVWRVEVMCHVCSRG
jgi:hypothetical protein